MIKTYVYYGYTIYYHSVLGHSLPYSVYIDGLFKYSDTIAGIKRLIRSAIGK